MTDAIKPGCPECDTRLERAEIGQMTLQIEGLYANGNVDLGTDPDFCGLEPGYDLSWLHCDDCNLAWDLVGGELRRRIWGPPTAYMSDRRGTVAVKGVSTPLVLDLSTAHIPWKGWGGIEQLNAAANARFERLRVETEHATLLKLYQDELVGEGLLGVAPSDMVHRLTKKIDALAIKLLSMSEVTGYSHTGFGCRCAPHDGGWVVFVPGVDGTNAHFDMSAVPEWFQPILAWCQAHSILFINFDGDGPIWDAFADYSI